MDALAGIFRNVYRCLEEHGVEYETFSVSLAEGVEIINAVEDERLSRALECIKQRLPPAWRQKIKVRHRG